MRISITVMITFLLNSIAFGCDCDNSRTFCETIEPQITEEEYVVKAIKLADIDHGMDVKIIHSYRGEIPNDTIRVWGDDGALCRVGTGIFEDGDTLIMKLYVIDVPENDKEQVGEYELSFCGQYYLEVKDNKVIGRITPERQEIEIGEFDELMTKENAFEECLTSSIEERELHQDIRLYPNPVDGELNVISNHRIRDIIIHDISGRTILKLTDINNEQLNINISDFKPGLYFIEFATGQSKSIVKKILKE